VFPVLPYITTNSWLNIGKQLHHLLSSHDTAFASTNGMGIVIRLSRYVVEASAGDYQGLAPPDPRWDVILLT
jgi:hypothetical protein